jgi:hypothetical protein
MCRPLALGLVGIVLALGLGCVQKPYAKPPPSVPPPRVIVAPTPPPDATPPPADELGPVWFRIGDRVVHETELDTWIRDDLFRRALLESDGRDRWSYRAEAAERMIDTLILEDEARRRGTKPEAVLAAEVEVLGPVTATELLRFFEENRERWPAEERFEDAAPDVRAYLEGQRPRQARENLRRRARVRFLAKPPKRSGNPANALSEPPLSRGLGR